MAKTNGGIIGPSNVPNPFIAKGVWKLRDAFNYIKAGLWPPVLGYQVNNSLRFNYGSSDYLERTSTSGNRRTFTFSTWLKRSNLVDGNPGDYDTFFSSDQAVTNSFRITFNDDDGADDDRLMVYFYTGTFQLKLITNQLFRDVSAWYHIVVAVDTTQATDTNRVKIYVNGSQITSFLSTLYPSQNTDTSVNQSGAPCRVGAGTSLYFNGYMSEVYLIDGQQLTPSSFGQTDSATGIWTPKAYTGTYGTNGFELEFKNSAALGTDTSGNGNNFTVNNLTSVDQSTDTPTNNFATLNPLVNTNGVAYTEGNLKVNFAGNTSWARGVAGSIVLDTGKWYWEVKQTAVGYNINGVTREDNLTFYSGQSATVLYNRNMNALQDDGSLYTNGVYSASAYTYATGDIVMFALDMTDKKMYVGKNGTWFNSGNPSAGTGQIFSSSDFTSGYGYVPITLGYDLGTDPIMEYNFGSPPYSVTGGYTDAGGFGNFSYQPPSGYYALCTRTLAKFG